MGVLGRPSINNHSKSICKGKRKSRWSGISSDLVAGLREIFGKGKTVEQVNKSAVEDDLHRCMEILNKLNVSPDLYDNAMTNFIQVPSARTIFIFMRVDSRIRWLNKTLRSHLHHPKIVITLLTPVRVIEPPSPPEPQLPNPRYLYISYPSSILSTATT